MFQKKKCYMDKVSDKAKNSSLKVWESKYLAKLHLTLTK